jgi:sugar-specific transcriptional regulator TrmB
MDNPLAHLPLEELERIREDLRTASSGHIRGQKIIAQHLGAVNEAIRAAKASETDIVVTDHALVRFLERIEGVDIEAIRSKIRTMVHGKIDPKSDHDIVVDEDSRAVFVVRRGQTITTTLHADQSIPEVGQLSVMKGT